MSNSKMSILPQISYTNYGTFSAPSSNLISDNRYKNAKLIHSVLPDELKHKISFYNIIKQLPFEPYLQLSNKANRSIRKNVLDRYKGITAAGFEAKFKENVNYIYYMLKEVAEDNNNVTSNVFMTKDIPYSR